MARKSSAESVPIFLPEGAIANITELIQHREHIQVVAEKTAEESPAGSIPGLSARLVPKTGLPASVVGAIISALYGIKTLERQSRLGPKALVEAITNALRLQTDDQWKSRYLSKWIEATPTLQSVLKAITEDHPLLVSGKAHQLAYTQQNLLVVTRLITDVRPVFDTTGAKIVETLLLYTLALTYTDGRTEPRMMTFALDQQDVINLRKQCERAERKMKVVSESLKGLNPVVLPEKVEL